MVGPGPVRSNARAYLGLGGQDGLSLAVDTDAPIGA